MSYNDFVDILPLNVSLTNVNFFLDKSLTGGIKTNSNVRHTFMKYLFPNVKSQQLIICALNVDKT